MGLWYIVKLYVLECPLPKPYVFFPNDLRCGFRKLKEEGGGKSVFWSPSGAENFVVVVFIFIMHATEIKISMVRIDKVNVSCTYLSLAHVSHFFSHMLQSVHLR